MFTFSLDILKINDFLMIYQSFTNDLTILIFCYFANHLPTIYQSLITDDLQIQFLCYYHVLPIICQSAPFLLLHCLDCCNSDNYSNLLYHCFTNDYQSDPVFYVTSVPMITNKLPIHHYQS